MSLFVRPDAAADIEEGHSWYESQRPGLGDEVPRRDPGSKCSWRGPGDIASSTETHGERTCADSRSACSTGSLTPTLSSSPASTRVETRVAGEDASDAELAHAADAPLMA